MKAKKICLLGSIFFMLIQYSVVNAYEENKTTEYNNGAVTTVQGYLSEEKTILEDFTKDIEINGILYTTSSIERNDTDNNIENEIIQRTEILDTNNEEKIKKYFGNTYSFENEEFKGELPITNIELKTSDQGSYEEIDEKKIEFNNYSQNDLNNIAKEININNKVYYLINVDWRNEDIEIIDGQEVPKSYKGTMKYQTILKKKNPNKYEVTVTYSGDAKRKNPLYEYTISYNRIEEPEEVKKEENRIIPIIISGLGIGILTALLLFNQKNIKIYNKTDKGNKLIGRFKINKKNKIIDLTKYQYKTKSNMYCLKLNNKIYRKMQNKTIYLQIDKIKKQVYINSQYIEIII